ncbi:MAG: VWA domain-containing protein [Anaerolineae bacterium]|nr:VWA domain-containing protein [Anaerolineae bacterium]
MPIAFTHPWALILLLALLPIVWLWRQGRSRVRRVRSALILLTRLLILVLLTLSIAGMQLVRAVDELAVIFLVDVSDSVSSAWKASALSFVEAALAEMGPHDRAGIVVFGSDALVDRPVTTARELGDLFSIPATGHTDIEEALRLGLALFPGATQKRLVLLSDGQENEGTAERAASLAAAHGVELDVVPLLTSAGEEVWVDAVEAPPTLHQGESFNLVVKVQSTTGTAATIRVVSDGQLVAEEAVQLEPGLNSYVLPLVAGAPGFSTFRVQVVADQDTFHQNNQLAAFSLVHGAPRVLLVAREASESENLVAALTATGLQVEETTPARLSSDLTELGEYAVIVLVNVPAAELGPRKMAALQTYVRDLGRGLVCIGGEESYGVGGYFRTPLEEVLPVEMRIKDKARMPTVALVFVVDKSGSMSSGGTAGGPPKVELAKEAVIRSVELLGPEDQLGVVAFDDSAYWVVDLAPLEDVAVVQGMVGTIRAGGGTDIFAGLKAAAKAIIPAEAQVKHVVLLTDGGADPSGIPELVDEMRAADVTLSVVAVGQDYAPFLEPLAVRGGGRFHFVQDPASIPEIFAQETAVVQRAYIIEETFFPEQVAPSPILDGIAAVPALYGYVGTSGKDAAQVVLVSAQNDPILAAWQYGLGRAVAWTSDAWGRWAREWVTWEGFPRFWAQAVRWTIIEAAESGLETRVVQEGEQARVTVDVVDQAGDYLNGLVVRVNVVAPTQVGAQGLAPLVLRQTAPGHYEGEFAAPEEGVYLLGITAGREEADGAVHTLASQATGFVRGYSDEYRRFGADTALLARLAEIGHGRELHSPEEAFTRPLAAVRTHADVWPWLLTVAVCLLPLDVGLRRVMISLADVRRWLARGWARLRRRRVLQPAPSGLERLLVAKERGVRKQEAGGRGQEARNKRQEARGKRREAGRLREVGALRGTGEGQEGARDEGGEEGEELTARLLRAKRRARRE